MYRSYWGLASRPFDDARRPEEYYPAESHQTALLKLRYAVDNGCEAALVTGAAGVGKSMLLECLEQQLGEEIGCVIRLPFPQLCGEQLLAYLAHQITPGESQSFTSAQALRRLEGALHDWRRRDQHVLLLVDEAQALMRLANLETLRLLLNLTIDGRAAWTLLLSGQTSFLSLLARAPDLESRLRVKCMLRPFTLDETVSYVSHRLDRCGAERTIFDERALETVHQLSGGLPRNIHRLCDLALLIGYAEERARIDAACIESVWDELALAFAAA